MAVISQFPIVDIRLGDKWQRLRLESFERDSIEDDAAGRGDSFIHWKPSAVRVTGYLYGVGEVSRLAVDEIKHTDGSDQ